MKEYSAAVVGLGSIGQGLDYDQDIDRKDICLTHTAAYFQHNGFHLVAGVDTLGSFREKFSAKYKSPAFETVSELKKYRPDVISICVPSHLHKSTFDEVIDLGPKAIVCEKPISDSINDADEMVKKAQSKQCLLLVNFIRRFEKGHVELKKKFDRNEFGKIRKVSVFYSKGVLNNGSHFINLLSFFFGEPVSCKVLKKGNVLENSDLEPDFLLHFQSGVDAYFLAGNEDDFSVKEIVFLTEKGIINYQQGGVKIEYFPVEISSVFKDYKIKSFNSQLVATDFNRYQWYTMDALYNYLENGIDCESDGSSALNTQLVVDQIFSQCSNMEGMN
ncbi:Gfo/Idh/MocA family protein [Leptospira meyeri]|uniref:Gfo/Idh/MocA family protein n=1 Tax=Leptospira meyeri TaxID=29508 RepID=UPI000C299CDE|nr:Gfo/Idh/MocA family oxidoreductase [Leptospira meyeri]PKA27056.1 dehydrogenase [Leptospira sp. mixed culture ATI2-C-A1]TGM20828.1 gfo/Idh/MocA family oxidoreductase [Leptospira meyeri]TGM71590.1 gfo/Idh/MocA family oxidoreductase [Leptospira meyeri]